MLARVRDGKVNAVPSRTSRSVWSIVRANVFTWFNLILGALWVLMITFGSWQDALFGLVLVFNTAIGIAQEVRAKIALDRLALVTMPKAQVVRDARLTEVAVGDVVLDDVVLVGLGDQVVADGRVDWSDGLEVDESLLTGESASVSKSAGDEVMSGSFVVAGRGAFRTTAVGAGSRAQRIAAEGRKFTRMRSEVMNGINAILKVVGLAIIPIGALTVLASVRISADLTVRITDVVAALVAMVPEGLVLLSSIAFAVSAVVLARHKVLANELAAVEGLARTDVVCADKTGTLTEPQPVFGRFEGLASTASADNQAVKALGALAAASTSDNATVRAIRDSVEEPEGWKVAQTVPFSSARKWSAASFEGRGTWVLGAPDVLFDKMASVPEALSQQAEELASAGPRVLLLAHSGEKLKPESPPERLEPSGFVLLAEKVRADAGETIRYLGEQGVTVKVVSGDAPETASAIAAVAGVPGAGDAVDARTLPDDGGLADTMERMTVFGRVAPEQKSRMIAALQSRGHVVAMTGDGVNDVLAVKTADLGIAMGSGAPATRAVAQLVLLDGRFAELPLVMAEGRRVLANAERVAKLFVTKTAWASVLAVIFGLLALPYPFLPRQITLVGSFTIGIPAFFLALSPNPRRYEPGFVRRVVRFAAPAGVVIGLAVTGTYALGHLGGIDLEGVRTMCSIVLSAMGLWVIVLVEMPLRGWRLGLIAAMAATMLMAFVIPASRDFFQLASLGGPAVVGSAVIAAAGCGLLTVVVRLSARPS